MHVFRKNHHCTILAKRHYGTGITFQKKQCRKTLNLRTSIDRFQEYQQIETERNFYNTFFLDGESRDRHHPVDLLGLSWPIHP